MSAHTAGKWFTNSKHGNGKRIPIVSEDAPDDDQALAWVDCDDVEEVEAQANVALICAAPDLLAALKRQEAHLETALRMMNEEPTCPECGADEEHSEDCSIHALQFLADDARAAIAKAGK